MVCAAVMKRSKTLANSRFGTKFARLTKAAPWLRRSRPSLSAARPSLLWRPVGLAAARWDGPDISCPEGLEARPTVVAVVDNAASRPALIEVMQVAECHHEEVVHGSLGARVGGTGAFRHARAHRPVRELAV